MCVHVCVLIPITSPQHTLLLHNQQPEELSLHNPDQRRRINITVNKWWEEMSWSWGGRWKGDDVMRKKGREGLRKESEQWGKGFWENVNRTMTEHRFFGPSRRWGGLWSSFDMWSELMLHLYNSHGFTLKLHQVLNVQVSVHEIHVQIRVKPGVLSCSLWRKQGIFVSVDICGEQTNVKISYSHIPSQEINK